MIYVALGALTFLLILWAGFGKFPIPRRGWRIGASVLALAAFTGAGLTLMRGHWGVALALAILGAWSATSARRNPPKAAPPAAGRMSVDEARSILGVGPNATREEVQAAYTRLMRLAHPDKGGTTGLAAQVNAARNRLLGR